MRAVRAFREALSDRRPQVRRFALIVLASHEHFYKWAAEEVPELIAALARSLAHEPSEYDREQAAVALGNMTEKSEAVAPVLTEALSDESAIVREQAKRILDRLKKG
jgi:HEAT repeat protein